MVPISALAAVDPVVNAEVRSTDMVPRTTQNPWLTSVTLAISTASANPIAPRTLFWNHTDRRFRWPEAITLAVLNVLSTETGRCSPSRRCHSGRASACALTCTVRPTSRLV